MTKLDDIQSLLDAYVAAKTVCITMYCGGNQSYPQHWAECVNFAYRHGLNPPEPGSCSDDLIPAGFFCAWCGENPERMGADRTCWCGDRTAELLGLLNLSPQGQTP